MSARQRHHLFQSSMPPVASTPAIVVAPPQENDLFPFKLYRGGAQVRQAAALSDITFIDAIQSGDSIKGALAAVSYRPLTSSEAGAGCINFTRAINVNTITVEPLVAGTRVVIDHSVVTQNNGGGPALFLQVGATCLNWLVEGFDVTGFLVADNDSNFLSVKSGANIGGSGVHETAAAVPFTGTVRNCAMRRWGNGILTTGEWNGNISLENCVMEDCGIADQFHQTYLGLLATLAVRGCTYKTSVNASAAAVSSHMTKTRARVFTDKANKYDQSAFAQARCIDFPNGGTAVITGNIFIKGNPVASQDSNQILSFGPEQRSIAHVFLDDGRTHSILFAQNTLKDFQTTGQDLLQVWDLEYVRDRQILHSGIAVAGDATSITLEATDETSHQQFVIIVSGTGTGSYGVVSGFNTTTRVASIAGGWVGASPIAGSGYRVCRPPIIQATLKASGACQGGSATTVQLAASTTITPDVGDAVLINRQSVFEDAVGYITGWDGATKIATIAGGWSTAQPAAGEPYRVFSKPTAATVTKTVRNNIVASTANSATTGAQGFVAQYPDNSQVNMGDIASDGQLTITPIAGSNADADLEYVGEFQAPRARTDSFRGAYAPVSLPAWRVSQAVGEWRDLGTKPQDASSAAWGVAGDGALGATSGPRDAIGAWCGAAKFGTKVINGPAPGGHDGYRGNWSIGIDLSLDAPLYVEIAPTSTFANVILDSKLYADGRPPSAHTYSACVPMPTLNRVFRMGSAAVAGNGNFSFGNIVSLNVGAGTYEADGTYAECPVSIGTDSMVFQDPVTYDVYVQTGQPSDTNTLRRYNVASNTWSLIWSFNGSPPTSPTIEKQSSGVDTRRRRALLHRLQPFYPTTGGPCLVNLPIAPQSGGVNDQSGITQCTFSGPAASVFNDSSPAGWAFAFMPHPTDPDQDWFYARRQWSGGLMYRIKAVPDGSNQLFCEQFPTSGGGLLPDGYGGNAGIYNKMQAFPEYGGIFIVIEYEKNAHFLRTI